MNNVKKALILSYKANDELRKFIQESGYEIIETERLEIDERIADHADLQIFQLDTKTYIAEPSVYEYYKEKLSKYNKKVLKGSFPVSGKYPEDCYYNIVFNGDYYICKDGIIDEEIKKSLKDFQKINVKQAYTKCMCICLENLIITCDKGIYSKLIEYGKKCEFVEIENIKLDGFNSGFLGGSCGIISNKLILFTGDIRLSKNYEKLIKILNENGYEPVFPRGELVDLGSIFLVEGEV